MSRLCFLAPVVVVLVGGCGENPAPSTRAQLDTTVTPTSGPKIVVCEPVVHGNLTIFPVASSELRSQDRFITLDEGLRSRMVEIYEVGAYPEPDAIRPEPTPAEDAPSPDDDREAESRRAESEPTPQSTTESAASSPVEDQIEQNDDPFSEDDSSDDGNDVNRLLVLNRSERPLYLMPGEIIVGGSQDRTIGAELVIQPGTEPVPIEVFCVEHGRWGQRGVTGTREFLAAARENSVRGESVAVAGDTGEAESLGAVADTADSGKFVASVGNVDKRTRMAVQASKLQSEVWQEVSRANAVGNADNESDTFVANYALEDAVRRLEPYIESLQDPVAATDRIVGVVVCINGKPESMDVFESTPLFKKLWPKLLKSYALDAANAASLHTDSEKPTVEVCTRETAQAFLDEALNANVAGRESNASVAVTKRSTDNVVSFEASMSGGMGGAAGGGMGGGGMLGGAVHASGYSK